MGTGSVNLPPGFQLEQPQQQTGGMNLPSGFQLETQQPQSQSQIGPARGGINEWLRDVEADIRYGGDMTWVGKTLKTLGAHGIDVGSQAGTQENALASPVLGAAKMAQGVTEPTHPWQATKDLVGGALQAASLPAAFVAPEKASTASVDDAMSGLQKAKAAFDARRAARLVSDPKEWQRINDLLDVPAKAIRIGRNAQSIDQAATLPGRGLAQVGLTADTLDKMQPLQRLGAIAKQLDPAGQAVADVAANATQAGKALDAGKSVTQYLKGISNPQIQEGLTNQFNALVQELGIQNLSKVTPQEAWGLRRALQDKPGLMSLARAVNSDLVQAVPEMKPASQLYSDLIEASNAALKQVKKGAVAAPPPTLGQRALQVGKDIVLPWAARGAAGAAGYGAIRALGGLISPEK